MDEFILMWIKNGLIPELESLLLRAKINPESSEVLKQAKEITEKELFKKDKCKGSYKNNWGMMDGAEFDCGYNSDICCEDCLFGLGDKDPRIINEQKLKR